MSNAQFTCSQILTSTSRSGSVQLGPVASQEAEREEGRQAEGGRDDQLCGGDPRLRPRALVV